MSLLNNIIIILFYKYKELITLNYNNSNKITFHYIKLI